MKSVIWITPSISIDESELDERFIRASGPGGQNVNKVSSAVQLRFNVARSPSIPSEVRERLLRLAGRQVSAEGVLVIIARRFRTQERNRLDARERLADLIRRASERPKPRRKTAPSRASKQRRLEQKRLRAAVKRRRVRVSSED
jgi:ribosome-associated protein